MLARAFRFRYAPVAVHLIPTRRCNLSCTYCNEYDDHSDPVAAADVLRRIDLLASLGTGITTLSGGEPLLHPDLDAIVSHIRRRGMIATAITNGYLLTIDRIKRLNDAGLDHLQISIDNVTPDGVSKKSLKVLDKKLLWLAEYADFDVTINAVVGCGIQRSDDALTITQRASALGFSTTAGIIHDGRGQLVPLGERQRRILAELVKLGKSPFDFAGYNRFQRNLSEGRPNDWQCRAGSRYLYVCEDGLVHWCSQQRGHPAIPLEEYTLENLEREYRTAKTCAPFCTVGCVHRVAQVDELRANPLAVLDWFISAPGAPPAHLPLSVRCVVWMFISNPQHDLFRRVAVRVLGVK